MNSPATCSNRYKSLCLLTVLLSTATSSLMQTFLTISLPTVTAELEATAWYGWISGLYLVTSTFFIPLWAILSDKTGPRSVYLAGMLTWMVGTIGVSISESTFLLLAARTLQGIGAAAIVPTSFAALTTVYQKNYGKLVGLMGAIQATVTLAGGPLGGWLATWLGWRNSLQLVAAIAIIPIALGLYSFPNKTFRTKPSNEKPAHILRSPTVRRCIIQTMLLSGIAFGVSTYLPLLLQSHFQLNLAQTAIFTTPTLLGIAIGSVIGGFFAEKYNTTRIAWIVVLIGLSLSWIPSIATVTIGSALAASGVGIGLPAQLITVEQLTATASKAGGLIQASRNIGGAVGVAVLGLPLQLHIAPKVAVQYTFATMFIIAIIASFIMMVVAQRKQFGVNRVPE